MSNTFNAANRICERKSDLIAEINRLQTKFGDANVRANAKIQRYTDFVSALDILLDILHRAGVADNYKYCPISSEFYGIASGMMSRLPAFKKEIEPLLSMLD